jgi:hypothetical protein
MAKIRPLQSVAADPESWSDKSKQSVAYWYIREYVDIEYECWRCRAKCVFTGQDQKYTYEVRKASIDQRRKLCEACWSTANHLRSALRECEVRWAQEKPNLRSDREFLEHWQGILTELEAYEPYKSDTAKKRMLARLLAAA